MTGWNASTPPPRARAIEEWELPSVCHADLFAGDTLALYTDGVTEAADGDGEEFGEQRGCWIPCSATVTCRLSRW